MARRWPYYGAEAFGLAAVGAYTENHGAPQVLSIADDFRYAPSAYLGLLTVGRSGSASAGVVRM